MRKAGFLARLLVGIAMTNCSPARNSWLKDVALNFHEEGFLDRDTFQVICESEKLDSLSGVCETRLLFSLAKYHDDYTRESNARFTGKKIEPEKLDISDLKTRKLLAQAYGNLLPGYITSETFTSGKYKAVYRIRKIGLLYEIHARDDIFAQKPESIE